MMPQYKVEYSRVFSHEIEAPDIQTAHHRSKNFAIGMSNNLSSPVKIISIYVEGYVQSTESTPTPSFYEKMVGGMRKKIDSMLE